MSPPAGAPTHVWRGQRVKLYPLTGRTGFRLRLVGFSTDDIPEPGDEPIPLTNYCPLIPDVVHTAMPCKHCGRVASEVLRAALLSSAFSEDNPVADFDEGGLSVKVCAR